jgi:hypothetical protein
MAGHPGEWAPLDVDDRSARTDQVDRAIRLAVRERGVGRPVKNLDRPRTECEQAERDPDERGEAADAYEEAGAAEERGVCARVRLEPAAAGEGARELALAPGIWTGDGYGGGGTLDGVCRSMLFVR